MVLNHPIYNFIYSFLVIYRKYHKVFVEVLPFGKDCKVLSLRKVQLHLLGKVFQLFDKGRCVYESPSVDEIKDYCQQQMETLWDETLRFENPQTYYVDLSQKLWDTKNQLLSEFARK